MCKHYTIPINIKNVFLKSDTIHIILPDARKPQSRQLELIFSKQPIFLKEWIITNYSGEETRVLLDKVLINEPLDKKLFNIGHAISNVRKELILQ